MNQKPKTLIQLKFECIFLKPFIKTFLFLCLFFQGQLLTNAQSSPPYELGFIPAAISEIDVAFPLIKKLNISGQADFQLVTQGAYTNKNNFAYVQRVVFRPWIIYSGFKNMKLFLGYAHNQKYEIKEAGNPETLEHRFIAMGTLAQKMPKGSIFEQVRFETKFFDDRNGIHRTVPRLRGRFGVNHSLRQQKIKPLFKAPNISYYTELMLKFAPKDYAEEHFDIFRQSVYYTAGLNKNLSFLLGIIGQLQLRSNGDQFDVYYGPVMSLKWNFIPKKREAFDNVDREENK